MSSLVFRLILASVIAVTSSQSHAMFDFPAEWDTVTVSTRINRIPVKVSAETTNNRLKALSVNVRGRTTRVPANELGDLISPRLRTLRIVIPDVGSPDAPSFFIEVEFEREGWVGANRESSNVRFHFNGLQYGVRHVSRRLADGKWQYESKEPGKPSFVIPDDHAQQHIPGDAPKAARP